MKYYMRKYTSEPLDLQITVTPTQSAVGVTASLEIENEAGEIPTPTPTVAWLDQNNWTVRIIGLEILTPGDYSIRIKLVDSLNKVSFAPTGKFHDRIIVVNP